MPSPLIRAFQWDLARQVERLEVLLKLLPRYAEWGYQELYLHLEDAVEYPSLPFVARPDAYSYQDLSRLVRAAERVGIGVVPIVNLLGHTQYLIKTPELRELNELRGEDGAPLVSGQICPLHPQTLSVASQLIGDMAPFCTAGKMHVGLDESFHLGKCPRCRAEVDTHGLSYHFCGHVNRLHALVRARGLRMGLWADMLNFIPEAISGLPADVIAYDWYYYPFRKHPRVELYNFAESDLATPLRARGIEYWGCPMNGAFRYEPLPLFSDRLANIRSWWKRCQTVGAGGLLITSWEAYRLALETTIVVDAAAADLWLNPSTAPDSELLVRGFARVYGRKKAKTCAAIAQSADQYPFSGYARWEINDRWDVAAGFAMEKQRQSEAAFFSRLKTRSRGLPPAFSASVSFRAYLAQRDAFIQSAAAGVLALRQARASKRSITACLSRLDRDTDRFALTLKEGRRAARVMWRSSRNARAQSQNETILAHDAERLQAWRRWLRFCARQPEMIDQTTPVCGSWQLIFTVINVAPALQRVSVETRQSSGTWLELHGRYTIEFQAAAARPKARIIRPFSVPLDSPEQPLRLVVRGLGEVVIDDVVLTNGPQRLRLRGRQRFKLGSPAPSHGFPDITQRLEEYTLDFYHNKNAAPQSEPALKALP